MKKSFFHRGLYLEGLRQTRVASIVTTVLLCLISFFAIGIPFVNAIADSNRALEMGYTFERNVLSGLSAGSCLIFVAYAAVPIMTLNLFSFLNKRNTSDFYHSLPHTRVCMYLSFQAAVITQTAAIILCNLLFILLMSLATSSMLIVVFTPLLYYALSVFVCALLVAAAITLAMTITGTFFNNVILTGLILFLPRILLFVFQLVEQDAVFNAVEGHFLTFLSPALNMLFGIPFTVLGITDGDFEAQIADWGSIAYTFVLALVYIGVSAYLFHRRKSEAAGFSAPSPRMQAAYRIIIGVSLTVISTLALYSSIVSKISIDLSSHIIVWTFGIVFTFIYELITTKKWSNLLKCFPSLLIILAVNLASLGVAHGIFLSEMSFTPSGEEIKSITVAPIPDMGNHTTLSHYLKSNASGAEITDSELCELVAKYLKENVDDYRQLSRRDFQIKYFFNQREDEKNAVLYTNQTVTVRTAHLAKYRKVWIPTDLYSEFVKHQADNPDYRRALTTLPTMIEGSATLITDAYSIDSGSLFTDEQLAAIWATYREEVRSADIDTWFKLIDQDYGKAPYYIEFSFLDGTRVRRMSAEIYPEIAPRTIKLITSSLCTDPQDAIDFLNEIRQRKAEEEKGEAFEYYINMFVQIPNGEHAGTIRTDLNNDANFEILDNLLAQAKEQGEMAEGDPIIILNMVYYNPEYDKKDENFERRYDAFLALNMSGDALYEYLLETPLPLPLPTL